MKIVIKSNIKDFVKSLEEDSKDINKLLPKQIFRALTLIETKMKQNIRERLNVRSGSLLNSPQKDMTIKGNVVEGSVGPKGIPYAAVQEYGHTFPARFVEPRNKLALKWSSGGKTFFSKGHKIPSFTVPGVHYMRDAVNDMAPKIEEELGIFIEKQLGD